MATTTKPTGLTITRNGNAFTFSWKKGDKNYDAGQNLEWHTNNGNFTSMSVSKNETSKVKTLSETSYYPTNQERFLEWIEFKVRGKRAKYRKKGKTIKPTMSAWVTKRLDLAPPKKPQLTATMHESQWNVCTFAWEVETSDTDIYWFNDVEWETILVKESDITDGADLAWETDETYQYGTGTKTDSQVITEDSFDISDGSYTRWFRARSRGPAGASGWSYQKHVYGLSYQATIESAVATVQPAGGFQCRVVWEAPANPSHPIDKTTVEYSITVPDANLSCPDDASWTSANVSADTENKDAVVFPIDRLLANDQCLFVRVNTEHDGVNTYGVPKLVDGGVGALSNPTLNSVTIGDNYMVTINATNASSVEDSYLVILYRPASDPTSEIVLGTIPHGQTSKSVQAPDWSEETAYAFGVYAAVGDSTTISHDGALMKSAIVWGTGNVPKAPENVRVSATNISGTIRVEWDWTWTEADGAELSWADHEDAWESTDEPETYELSNIRNSRWNISGLETGVKWYVKVRLKKGTGENETYGPYSETKIIDLTSAPSIPTLVLSEPVITEKGSVTASWVYTTTDGTAQTYAEICEAELTTEGIEYGDIIAHTETAQHVTINAEDAGWQTGETYYLCVRVVSASGRVSDDWSAPVPIAIAEPLEVNITETSLVSENIETNPRTFSGNPISFETEMEEQFSELKVTIEPTQTGSGTASPDNVRPIYGVGEVDVNVVGKNKIPLPTLRGYWAASNGAFVNDTTWAATEKIPVLPNTTYHISCSFVTRWCGIAAYQSDGTYIDSSLGDTSSSAGHVLDRTFTTQSNCGYIAVSIASVNAQSFQPSSITDLQVELGTTATAYEPYTESTVSQEFDVSLTPTSKDTDPYLFKAVGDIYGDRLEEELVGATVNWNQLAKFNARTGTVSGISYSISSDGTVTLSAGTTTGVIGINADVSFTGKNGHVIYIFGCPSGGADGYYYVRDGYEAGSRNLDIGNGVIVKKTNDNLIAQIYVGSGKTIPTLKFRPQIFDLTQMFGSTIADYVYSLEQATAGSGIAWLKSYGFFTKPYYEYDAGTLKSVNPTAHVTRGVNAWDEEWEVGTYLNTTGAKYPSSTKIRNKNPISVLPNTAYFWHVGSTSADEDRIWYYDSEMNLIGSVYINHQTTVSLGFTTPNNCAYINFSIYNTTYNNDICINISDPTINGKYFQYEEHTYDLGNVVLRGIPKLVNNKLVYDGDIYEHDGSVQRRFRALDLSTLTWSTRYTGSTNKTLSASVGSSANYFIVRNGWINCIYEKYAYIDRVTGVGGLSDPDNKTVGLYNYTNTFSWNGASDTLYLVIPTGETPSGILVYELATPTTEQTDPFTQIQEVSKYGTLEYITTNDVPVGHNTTYLTRDIFGGYIDLVSGQLVVDKGYEMDLSRLSWGKGNTASGHWRFSTSSLPNVKMGTPTASVADALCSEYDTITADQTWTGVKGFAINNVGNYIFICDESYADVTSFKTALKNVSLCYPLATPLTYQLTPQQIQTLVGVNNVWSDSDIEVRIAESVKNVLSLKEMPLTLTVDKTNITAVIERANSYHIDRPDETSFDGFENETIAIKKGNVESFNIEDIIGSLDDGASYRLIVTVKDELGQSAEDSIDFEVHWTHQALIPEGQVVIDSEEYIAKITPQAPQGALNTDVCDIYRLSSDRPELIVKDGVFGETYVDPYPAIGQFGGYRLVFKTANGDYITEDNEIAWLDIDETLDIRYTIIDFDGGQIFLQYNVDVSNTWTKDFQETKYLGGSVQGDWNPAVSRTSSISAVSITITDEDQIEMIHRLAVNPSLCHVRTSSGASFSADVQVTENYMHEKRGKIASYTFAITRVDTEHLDGMTLAQWEDLQEEDELE